MAHNNLDGRVFARLQRFVGLPTDLQEDTKRFQAHIEQDKQKLFQIHHAALVKSVYSVKGKALMDAIIAWLQARDVPPAIEAPASLLVEAAPLVVAKAAPVTAVEASQSTEATLMETPAEAVAFAPVSTASTAPPPSATTMAAPVSAQTCERARQIAEALVLAGFFTPYKDDEKHLNAVTPTTTVVDGTVYARSLKHKAGVLGSITDGKDVYVVFNKTKKLYLFESDLAREPISELSGQTMAMEFDNTNFEFGVRVAHKELEKPELFNAKTESVQVEFVIARLNIGANYAEGNVKKLIEAQRSVSFADAPTSAEHRDQHSVGVPPTSTSEHQNRDQYESEYSTLSDDQSQPVGSSPTSLKHQGHHLDGRSPSNESSGQENGSSPTLAKHDEYHPVGAFFDPAATP